MLKDLKSEPRFKFRVPGFLASSEQVAEALGRIRSPDATFSISPSACPDVSIPASFVYQDGRKPKKHSVSLTSPKNSSSHGSPLVPLVSFIQGILFMKGNLLGCKFESALQ